jgi:hypothetical protein
MTYIMRIVGAIAIFIANAIWRVTGLRPAGRVLVRALGSKDETIRMLAGMFLVKAGKQAEPLLEEALKRRENLPTVLTILGDIGDRKFEPVLRQFSEDPDPEVAQAARDALRTLNANESSSHG